jgi:hypothetical protein
VFAVEDEWQTADGTRRYEARIAAVVATRRSSVVVSHQSAACLWGLPHAYGWPGVVHVTEHPESRRRSKNGVFVHRSELPPSDVVRLGDFTVTSLPRTLADLCRDADLVDAVVALDAALDRRNPRIARDDVADRLDGRAVRSGTRATRALEFSSDLAMTPIESVSRVAIWELGFPEPILQHEFRMRNGRSRMLDFWWPKYRVGGEADGKSKYTSAPDPADVIWQEKLREFEFLDFGVRFARWGWAECRDRVRLAVRLAAAGLPRTGVPRVRH